MEIYSMNAAGTNQVRLTDDNYQNSRPSWSPDGTRIAFSSNRDGANLDIFVMDSDGTNVVRVTDYSPSWADTPAWSPDGSKIAYGRYSGLSVIDLDSGLITDLTSGWNDGHPTWSPDGEKIAFQSQRNSDAEIYVMDADGSNQTRLTTRSSTSDWSGKPTWSPDGNWIAYVYYAYFGGDEYSTNRREIYRMHPDGTNKTQVTDNEVYDSNPSWEA